MIDVQFTNSAKFNIFTIINNIDGKKSLKYCPNCGTPLQTPNQKFCLECGTNLQSVGVALSQTQAEKSKDESSPLPESANEEATKPAKLNTYDLGISLENTAASILEKMGYTVEKRKRVPMRSGRTAEIDLLLTRGNRRRAVECKNYDPSMSVPVSDMHVFKSKLEEIGILSGIFITDTLFSEGARSLADSFGIELWDKDLFKEKAFIHLIGRTQTVSLVDEPILPLTLDFSTATSLNLRNSQFIHLISAALLYHPYHIVKYRLQARRNDPTGRIHKFSDAGSYFVDALDGDIVNVERNIAGSITALFKKKEERLKSKEDQLVSQDLDIIASVNMPVLSNSDYIVSAPEPEISEEETTRIIKSHLVEKNTKEVSYGIKVRGELETRSFTFVPRLNEIEIRGLKLVYVPKWDLEYEAGNSNFSRRFLGSSGKVLEDDLAKCRKCTILKKDATAVCETCGIPVCDKHLYDEGKLLCEDHISDRLREELKGKSVFSRFKLKR